ncbi:MAG: DNA helicase PcrA [Lachnospiraceae bacterium]|nr:DNA helicase PcrA [Lachnospiraceae bacterium]
MKIYDSLNDKQKEAVFYSDGPLLILAGAGSGKTRVLTHRVAYLIHEKNVNPYNIMAITFTNKAAREMRDRINRLIGHGAEAVWVSTFHSACVRILRRYIDRIGYNNNFTIYDSDDQKTAIKAACKKLQVDTKFIKERAIMSAISMAKNNMITPEEYRNSADDIRTKIISKVYEEYQSRLKKNNALDFDDLLVKTIELFKSDKEVLMAYQDRLQYIMVDEYQDTNRVQFEFIKLLADKYKNICVVGDDDQSIYKFRGADISNILNFEQIFTGTKVIKLEQNYRSTKNVLEAANQVIAHNYSRKQKTLWTEREAGDLVEFRQLDNEYHEAEFIVNSIKDLIDENRYDYKDIACLYRTNAQSRVIEEALLKENIPYKIIGGQNFYQRKEIKDLIAYLKTISNGDDDFAVRRIINVPKRGIGATTIEKVQKYADDNNMSFYQALEDKKCRISLGPRAEGKVNSFVYFIQRMKAELEYDSISDLMENILSETGYEAELKMEDTDEANARLENINEFFNKIVDYEDKCKQAGKENNLDEFLEEIALVADIDNFDENENYVVLMTVHSAKGLEFPKVFLCGMEDGLFPSKMTLLSDDKSEIEEERRLCYVAITRAMDSITMTSAKRRMMRGDLYIMKVSRFITEIPGLSADLEKTRKKRTGMRSEEEREALQRGFKRKTSYSLDMFKSAKLESLDYQVGDRVRHMKFGDGTVTDIKDGGKDYEVTVDFDTAGTRKLFATFAKLKKI